MYLMEWMVVLDHKRYKPGSIWDEQQKKNAEREKKHEKKLFAQGLGHLRTAKESDIHESRSEVVDDNGSIYRKTKAYLDVCTYNDDKRGLITLLMGVVCLYLIGGVDFLVFILRQAVTGLDESGEVVSLSSLIFPLVAFSVVVPLLYFVFFRYLIKAWRLEAFTVRRLMVRFNRETRKVYLLRPGFLGGVKAYDWEEVDAILPKNMPNHEGIGGMLVLAVKTEENENPYRDFGVDGAFLGLPSRDYQHLLSFWEYIRRFMEDGADAVPAPKRLRSKWPNPLTSMWTVSRLSLPGGFDLGRSFLWLRLALTPVFVIWGLGHYASLLLSYEGRFPKAIRQASGESELRSWLELLAYNLLPLLYTAVGLWLYYAWRHGLDWRLPLSYLGL
ncbi:MULTISPECIES: DUF6708 domain-containing protein [Chromobacterium]|nr:MULTISPECIES: DUF6708 domain-containing protein [Chromobacterium]MBN3006661.1 hypothetical protein [Chromobacterium alkanivorans]MDH0344549.1 hypothetical protein [Chromobacterium haemolyticum]PTU71821.1 hypothetical protein DBB33_21400 [Chromobacterium haemolyticum]QOD83457.1 hypothetical protein IEZ30_02890 [Chromobacterium haemolyticum]